MQDPVRDIPSVVSFLAAAVSPDIQRAAVSTYFTSNAGFRHPLCAVTPGPLSREDILGIYQWYRVISPHVEIEVKDIIYDRDRNILVLDVTQLFHIRFSPLKPVPSRLLVRLTLQEADGRHYIAFQEDLYHPDDFLNLLVPPVAPLLRFVLSAAGFASAIYAKSAQVFGNWRVGGGEVIAPNRTPVKNSNGSDGSSAHTKHSEGRTATGDHMLSDKSDSEESQTHYNYAGEGADSYSSSSSSQDQRYHHQKIE